MEIALILQIITAIINMIMQLIGGGTFPQRTLSENVSVQYHLSENQWTCGQPYWPGVLTFNQGQYSGQVAVDCEVQGTTGGNLIQLRRHLVEQLERNVVAVNEGPRVSSIGGLPATSFDVTVAAETKGTRHEFKGVSSIATNGFTELKAEFKSTVLPREGALKHVRAFTDGLEISPSPKGEGWYSARLTYSAKVTPPVLLNGTTFRNQLKAKLEEQIVRNRERVLNDIASKL